MSRLARWLLLGICGLVALAIMAALGLYLAATHVPTFYREALAQEEAEALQANDEMLARASRAISAARKVGDWEASFTAAQLNGWLAVDLPQNHPGVLPPEIDAPRVAIYDDRFVIGWRSNLPHLQGVLSLEATVEVVEPNVLAIRIRHVRAGAVPLPMGMVLEAAGRAAREARVSLEWLQQEGDPVAIIRLEERVEQGQVHAIQSIRVTPGEIHLAGSTRPVKVAARPPGPTPEP